MLEADDGDDVNVNSLPLSSSRSQSTFCHSCTFSDTAVYFLTPLAVVTFFLYSIVVPFIAVFLKLLYYDEAVLSFCCCVFEKDVKSFGLFEDDA